jgi:dihydroorotase
LLVGSPPSWRCLTPTPVTTQVWRSGKEDDIAARDSYANYAFMLGGTNDNL